jgi:hypothetical protein
MPDVDIGSPGNAEMSAPGEGASAQAARAAAVRAGEFRDQAETIGGAAGAAAGATAGATSGAASGTTAGASAGAAAGTSAGTTAGAAAAAPFASAAALSATAADLSAQNAASMATVNGSFTTFALANAALASLAEGHSYEVTADGANIGIWTKRSGVLVRTSTITISGLEARTTPLVTQAAVMQALLTRPGPAVGDAVEVVQGPIGTAEIRDEVLGLQLAIDGQLLPLAATIATARSDILALAASSSLAGPAVEDYVGAAVDESGALISGERDDGRAMVRDDTDTLVPAGGTPPAPARIVFQQSATLGTSAPADSTVDAIFLVYGQSYTSGGAEDYLTSSAYNTAVIAGAYMPSVGVHPGSTPFTAFAPLKSLWNPAAPLDAMEPPTIEMGRAIAERWAAAGFTNTRIIVAGQSHGGQQLQNLMRGSADWEYLMAIAQQIATISIDAGRRPVFYGVFYGQGEANKSGGFFGTRASWAADMSTLQAQFDGDLRQISGQAERVMMVLAPISRSGYRPAGVTLGAIDAAILNAGNIACANPCYALEHGSNSHPKVVGYRRLGRSVGDVLALRTLGHARRLMRPTRWWMHSTTELRYEIEMPLGASLAVDTSGEIVSMTTMNAGRGWSAWDRAGLMSITAAGIAPAGHPDGSYDFATGYLQFSTAPDQGSLRAYYAGDSDYIGAGLGGSIDGPRGCFRAVDGYVVPGFVTPMHSWMQPAALD